jgi:hypothetical protein
MRTSFEHTGHLFRLAGLFAAGVLVFVVGRALLVPDTFGTWGHYRAAAVAEAAARSPVHAGRAACSACHSDVVDARAGSAHEPIGCESCHGPLAAHAADPASVVPERPDPAETCASCHRALEARPGWFPTVDPREHAADEPCTSCHDPHAPGF